MTRRRKSAGKLWPALLAGALGLSACDAAPEVVGPAREASAARQGVSAGETLDAPGQKLARALALAMRDTHVRTAVRHAFRDSRKTEHKLVLQEFVQTPRGRAVLEAAAAAAGVQPSEVQGWISGLPRLDFYVPLREHRRSWQGSSDLVVGLNIAPDETTLTGYGPDGSVLHLDRRKGVPSQTVIILHTAEPKHDRADAGRPAKGETIEDAHAMVIEPPLNEPCCDTGGGGTGGTGGSSGPVLYIRSFYPEVGDGWGDLELHFKQYNGYVDPYTGQIVDTKVWEWSTSGFYENQWHTANKATGGGNLVRVWEDDRDWEPTDHDNWGHGWMLPYRSTDPAYQADNSFTTAVIGNCYFIHEDWVPQAYCSSYSQEMVSIWINYQYR